MLISFISNPCTCAWERRGESFRKTCLEWLGVGPQPTAENNHLAFRPGFCFSSAFLLQKAFRHEGILERRGIAQGHML